MSGLTPGQQAALDRTRLGRQVVTPEGVPLNLQLARAGDRAGAFVIDAMIQIGVLFALALVASLALGGEGEESWLAPLVVVAAFLLTNFYFVFFELRWRGTTPGKRALGLRVVDARGGQLEGSAVMARNLIRELEVWMPLRALVAGSTVWPGAPGWGQLLAVLWTFVFLLFPLFNRDRARVGDLIAGTRVVVRPKVVLLPDLVAETAAMRRGPGVTHRFGPDQLAVYGVYELQVLEDLLRQDPGPSTDVAVTTVTEKIRAKIGYTGPRGDDARFLREFYAALRAHLEQKLLLGKRRADKYDRG
ncbi:MAG: RDD family protein [Kofleriaceae bacterium]|nr:RDD family protein [Kofleriaceae bacterium]